MTTIFEKIEKDKAHTHVFIIGVGKYPHLLNGEGTKLDNPMGLRQLTSPPISAKAFADWILKNLYNPDAPLGSIELLLSPAGEYVQPQDGEQFPVEGATMENIKTAFDRWYNRCNFHKNNVAIFYFCGHGLEKIVGYPLLLAEDFGKNQLRLWENAIDFNSTYLGMARCQAKTQCYFIDACRQTPSELQEIQEIRATALVHPSTSQKWGEVLKLFATHTSQKAYGLNDQITRFTDALINCLNGLGSEKQKKQWLVTTGKLGLNVTKILEKSNKEPNTPQQKPEFNGTGIGIIHVCSKPPSVPVDIALNPIEASNFAKLSLFQTGTCVSEPQLDLSSQKWKDIVLPNVYSCRTYFPLSKYCNPEDTEMWVQPPYTEEEIEVIKLV